ncbi:MAG: hypothetical protein GF334_02370 [Candidatus Altiarchaeales archaeon]|nr:hypothetical protein [Candidatus Altiarchaeales archaeon]
MPEVVPEKARFVGTRAHVNTADPIALHSNGKVGPTKSAPALKIAEDMVAEERAMHITGVLKKEKRLLRF